jgi:hypothetical protein
MRMAGVLAASLLSRGYEESVPPFEIHYPDCNVARLASMSLESISGEEHGRTQLYQSWRILYSRRAGLGCLGRDFAPAYSYNFIESLTTDALEPSALSQAIGLRRRVELQRRYS